MAWLVSLKGHFRHFYMKKYLESYSYRKVIIQILNLHLMCYQLAAIILCPSNSSWYQNQDWPMDYLALICIVKLPDEVCASHTKLL